MYTEGMNIRNVRNGDVGVLIGRWMSVDPATERCGWVLWDGREYVDGGTIVGKGDGWYERSRSIVDWLTGKAWCEGALLLVVEHPEIFAGGKGEAANASGSVAKLFGMVSMLRYGWYSRHSAVIGGVREDAEVVCVDVTVWKGQLPKSVVERRVKRELPDVDGWIDDNHVDAAGLGLWYMRQSAK